MRATTKKPYMLLGLLFAASVQAAPHFDEIVVSDSKDGDAVETFAPDAPMIYVRGHMVDISNGSKVTIVWTAIDTHGAAPDNYKIDSTDLIAAALTNSVTGSVSKPNNGWPPGKYRVDLLVEGKPGGSENFEVEK